MFGQDSALRADMDQLMEDQMQDEINIDVRGGGASRLRSAAGGMDPAALSRALFDGSSAVKNPSLAKSLASSQSQFNKILPRLALDDDGNLVDDSGDYDMSGGGDDLLGDDYGHATSFGIGENMPDASDATFTAGGGGGVKRAQANKGRAAAPPPPMIKEISFANGETGADWFKVSAAGGAPRMKVERGNVIASRPSEKMEGVSPVYQVKVERRVDPTNTADDAAVTSETYDGLTMFWFDACEQDGSIYLFGKALLPDQKSTTSCCVRVCNMERNLFVLPRAFKVLDPEDETHTVTDEEVKLVDIHSEVKEILASHGVTKFRSKMVRREYVFDREMPDIDAVAREAGGKSSLLDTDDGVPRESQYLKVVYPFSQSALERDMKGRTFSRIFGTRSTALELFLLKRNLMGPCWITIKHVAPAEKAHSWCKFNFQTPSQKEVAVLEECPDAPLFSVLSLTLKTVLNDATQRHEIVMASYMYHDGVSVDGPTTNETDVTHCSIVSKLPPSQMAKAGTPGADVTIIPIPIDFELKAKQINAEALAAAAKRGGGTGGAGGSATKNKLEVCGNERALLSLLMARIHLMDPDVIVGHDLHGFSVDVLLNRMGKSAIGLNWSKLGRIIRSKMPQSNGRGDDSFSLVDRGVGAGRLMLDTLVSSKEFLIGQKNYTLSYLAETQLKVRHEEVDASMVPQAYKQTTTLLDLVKHNENDAFLQMSLMFKMVMLPLSKQLTCLCGNMWSRSLRAARAERVEFLLMHDFHRSKFIIPEKYTSRERKEREAAREEAEQRKLGPNPDPSKVRALRAAKHKPQYAGGLVLEPKRGFYDKYVLLLDFNSLYPSIIQEFNICFTTIKHWQATRPGEMVAPPPAGSESGHLPKVIKRLVQRRRNVKDLLKKESNPAKREELDIRQKALKLVANSMYGCLGFVNSRFYAESLAALITSQGREILQSSVELTNTLNANVIYGDTDSIMVYSNETDLAKAMDLGRRIRTEINKRHKILEIDIDGVFKNMLLLRKKKYAALKIVETPGGGMTSQREVKGLDLVRRDWCPLSKEIGFAVLGEILSGAPREDVVERIHAHLMKLRDDIKANRVSLDKFVITKGLTKNPKEYTDAKNMPHVKVALDLLAKGKSCKAGDFVPYVICKNDSDNVSLASRAYDPAHVMALQGALELDLKWYLTNQILPPVARLIGPIEETDAGKVAYALGLDPKAFHNFGSKDEKVADDEDDSMGLAPGAQDDEEKFKHAAPLIVQCPHCKEPYQFPGIFHKLDSDDKPAVKPVEGATNATTDADGVTVKAEDGVDAIAKKESGVQGIGSGALVPVLSGLKCPNSLTRGCPGLLASAEDSPRVLTHFINRINTEVRRQTQAYYGAFFKCNDSGCGRRTRDLCVRGSACLATTVENFKEFPCKGRMEREVSASQLYLQLQYFRSLFDVERALELVSIENHRRKADSRSNQPQLQPAMPGAHAHIYKQLHAHMVSVLRQSAYYWLSPDIFSVKISTKR